MLEMHIYSYALAASVKRYDPLRVEVEVSLGFDQYER